MAKTASLRACSTPRTASPLLLRQQRRLLRPRSLPSHRSRPRRRSPPLLRRPYSRRPFSRRPFSRRPYSRRRSRWLPLAPPRMGRSCCARQALPPTTKRTSATAGPAAEPTTARPPAACAALAERSAPLNDVQTPQRPLATADDRGAGLRRHRGADRAHRHLLLFEHVDRPRCGELPRRGDACGRVHR